MRGGLSYEMIKVDAKDGIAGKCDLCQGNPSCIASFDPTAVVGMGLLYATASTGANHSFGGWSLGSDYLFNNRKIISIIIGIIGAAVAILLSFSTPSTPLWMISRLSIFFGLTGMGWNAVWLTLVGEISFKVKGSAGLGLGLFRFIICVGGVLGSSLFLV